MPTTDEELVAAARAGDRGALEALLARHQDRVYRFGMKMCRDPEDARDVVQETLLAMARSIGDFRGSSSLSTWLYGIARSYCIKKRRKSKFAPEREESLDAPGSGVGDVEAPGVGPEAAAEQRQIAVAIDEALGSLDPGQREVVLLRDVEGLEASEVAEVLGLSVAAVKSRLHRARLRLRAALAPALGVVAEEAPAAGCPNVLELYSKHLEGEISTELCGEMERHLTECPRCRTACDSLKRTLSLCRSVPTAGVPEPVQRSVRDALRAFLASP